MKGQDGTALADGRCVTLQTAPSLLVFLRSLFRQLTRAVYTRFFSI